MNLPKPNKINAEKYISGMSLFNRKIAKIKLSANESALGPSPKAVKEFSKVSKNLRRYPDSDGVFLYFQVFYSSKKKAQLNWAISYLATFIKRLQFWLNRRL